MGSEFQDFSTRLHILSPNTVGMFFTPVHVPIQRIEGKGREEKILPTSPKQTLFCSYNLKAFLRQLCPHKLSSSSQQPHYRMAKVALPPHFERMSECCVKNLWSLEWLPRPLGGLRKSLPFFCKTASNVLDFLKTLEC